MNCQLHNHGHVLLQTFLSMEVNHTSLWLIDFSKFIVVCKVSDHRSEQTVATFIQIFSELGVPDAIRCDHGTNFTSQLFLSFYKGLDVKLLFSSTYHHSGNPAERVVRIIKNQLETWFTGVPLHSIECKAWFTS